MNFLAYSIGGLGVALALHAVNPGPVAVSWVQPAAASARVEAPAVEINRALKGDRLVAEAKSGKPAPRGTGDANPAMKKPGERPKVLAGCDTVFSPLSVSARLNVVGRCIS